MSMTLSDLRRLLRKGLGNLETSDLSNDECDELLNLALWEIESDYPHELKKTSYETPLVTGTHEYSLVGAPLLDAIRSISFIDENGQSQNLDRMTRKTFDDEYNTGSVTSPNGRPTHYLREGNLLIVWPPPLIDLNGVDLVLAIQEGIDSVTSTGTGLERNYDGIVLAGAIAWGHFFRQDYEKRDKAENFKISKIRGLVPTVAKDEIDSRHAGLDVLWDHPSVKRSSSKFPTG